MKLKLKRGRRKNIFKTTREFQRLLKPYIAPDPRTLHKPKKQIRISYFNTPSEDGNFLDAFKCFNSKARKKKEMEKE
jgi:hypothetical protein